MNTTAITPVTKAAFAVAPHVATGHYSLQCGHTVVTTATTANKVETTLNRLARQHAKSCTGVKVAVEA